MTKKQALNILQEVQLWRRGKGKYNSDKPTMMPFTPIEYGMALDVAIDVLKATKYNYGKD